MVSTVERPPASTGASRTATARPGSNSGSQAEFGVAYAQALTRADRSPLSMRRFILILVCALGLAVAVHGGPLDLDEVLALLRSIHAEVDVRMLFLLGLVYAVALALPFVPGMELGLLLMLAFGPRGIALVYAATLLGLSLSYAVGRVAPIRFTPSGSRGRDLAAPHPGISSTLHTMVSASRFGRFVPSRLTAWLMAHRYLALAICLNLPGNTVVGGGGGIALLCGLSGQYSYWRYLITIALAISPLPLLMLAGDFGLGFTGLDSQPIGEALKRLNAH